MGKGEIARYEQFLVFPQCFQKACFPGVSKGVIVWEWVKIHLKFYSLYMYHLLALFPKQAFVFTCLLYQSLENAVGKGEIAHNEIFLLFQCFLPFWRTFGHFRPI